MGVVLYKKKFCEMLIAHMAKGYSYTTFCAEINVGRQTLYDWEKAHPEWLEAKAIGYEKGLKLFETLAVTKSMGKKLKGSDYGIDMNAVTFMLKTRFHKEYTEKAEVTHSVNPEANKLKIEFVKPDETA